MDLKKVYTNSDDIKCNILQMVKIEPEWAANIIQWYEEKIAKVVEISNNILWFDDGSDFQTALYEILSVVNPELFDDDGGLKEPLEFIE